MTEDHRMRWPEYWGSCRPCSWTRDAYKINKIVYLFYVRDGSVSYALYISRYRCTNGCMVGEGGLPYPPPPPIAIPISVQLHKTHAHKTLNFLDPNCARFACCHFRAKNSLDFQGPPLPMPSKSKFIRSALY